MVYHTFVAHVTVVTVNKVMKEDQSNTLPW